MDRRWLLERVVEAGLTGFSLPQAVLLRADRVIE